MENDAFRVGTYTPLLPGRKNKLRKKILRGSFYLLILSLSVIAALSSFSVALRVPVKYTTYERIGNTECPDIPGTSLIYSGITISYSYNSTQNTPTSYSGFRCMPTNDKDINYYTDDFPYEEDQVNSGNVTKYITSTGSNHRDAMCAVCMVEGRALCRIDGHTTIETLPATNRCAESWTKQYEGFLMTGGICVHVEMVVGKVDSTNEHLPLHHEVLPEIGKNSIYNKDFVLGCVVCSK